MEFIERHDLQKIHYLNTLTYTQMKDYLGKKCKTEESSYTKYENIKRFCASVIKGRGQIIRTYAYSISTPLDKGGRLFCGLSVQGLPKPIRGFLMSHTTDIDMKNCHPTLLLYLCRKHNIICPNLEYFIHHREDILRTFPDRESAKDLFLASVNNDKLNSKEKNDFFRKFDKEMKGIQMEITKQEAYQDLYDSVPEEKKTKNWNGSAINRILCMFENKVLQIALSVVNQRGLEVAVPMFDGFMLYGKHEQDQSLLNEIEKEVEAVYPGMGMKWDYKEHTTPIVMPEGFVSKEKVHDEDVKIAKNDKEASDIIYKELKDQLVYSNGSYYFKKDHLWIQDEEVIRSSLRHYIMNSKIYRTNDSGELVDYAQNVKPASNIANAVMDTVMNHANNDWESGLFRSSLGYVLFNNGYWSGHEGVFHPLDSDSFNSSIQFTEKIPFDYDESWDDEKYEESIYDRFFRTPFGEEVGKYYVEQLARGLMGDCMKRFLVGVGPSNTGKSVISLALKSSCGGYYDAWNGANITYKQGSGDEAQRLRWIYLLKTRRIIVSNEIATNFTVDGNMVKKMSNGGKDDITGRLHGGNETKFQVPFLPILFAQDLPSVRPLDDAVITRIRAIPYSKVYCDEPSNELELKKDPNLEDEIMTSRFRQAFLRLLFKSYTLFHRGGRNEVEPEEIGKAREDVLGTETNVIDSFKMSYEITNNGEDFVLSTAIQQWLTDEKKGITITKFGMEMKRYATIHKLEQVESKNKKVGGKVVKAWFGIREAI